MKKQFKLGVIGGGFMAQAILKGAILSDFLRARKVLVADVSQKALDSLEYLDVNTTTDCRDVAENCAEFLGRCEVFARDSRRKGDQHYGGREKRKDPRRAVRQRYPHRARNA